MFTALLDTCVLWPSRQRDFLLSLAAEGAFRPVWSAVILEELEYEETQKLIDRGVDEQEAQARAANLIAVMRAAFADAEASGWEGLEGTYGLPDPDDEHVLAAAVVAGAGAIVTVNVKDFPPTILPLGLEVILPAGFAANTVEIDHGRGVAAIEQMARRSQRPRQSVEQVLDLLETRYKMHRAVEIIRNAR